MFHLVEITAGVCSEWRRCQDAPGGSPLLPIAPPAFSDLPIAAGADLGSTLSPERCCPGINGYIDSCCCIETDFFVSLNKFTFPEGILCCSKDATQSLVSNGEEYDVSCVLSSASSGEWWEGDNFFIASITLVVLSVVVYFLLTSLTPSQIDSVGKIVESVLSYVYPSRKSADLVNDRRQVEQNYV